jgi:hypothetical protein
MTFFQHILFNDRLTELHYEMFWKMTTLMNGITPDKFEVVLMVGHIFLNVVLYSSKKTVNANDRFFFIFFGTLD